MKRISVWLVSLRITYNGDGKHSIGCFCRCGGSNYTYNNNNEGWFGCCDDVSFIPKNIKVSEVTKPLEEKCTYSPSISAMQGFVEKPTELELESIKENMIKEIIKYTADRKQVYLDMWESRVTSLKDTDEIKVESR